MRVNTNLTKTRLYSTQIRKNHIEFVLDLWVMSNGNTQFSIKSVVIIIIIVVINHCLRIGGFERLKSFKLKIRCLTMFQNYRYICINFS